MTSHHYVYKEEDEQNHKFHCLCGEEVWFNKPGVGEPNAQFVVNPSTGVTAIIPHEDYLPGGKCNPEGACTVED